MRFLLLLFTLSISSALFAQSAEQRTDHFNLQDQLALEGYDAVAYFSNKAIKGLPQYAFQHQGLTYYFSSAEHRETFADNPTHFEPQYGGWCAYAMGQKGKKVGVNPETFKIVDGKLYLFYNAYFNNTLERWNENETELKTQADHYWSALINKH